MTKYKIVYKDKDGLVHTELHRFETFFKASETVYGWWLNRHDQYAEILAIRARQEGV